jgi:hypothetical protein
MGQISIMADGEREIAPELIRCIAWLRKSGIHARSALAERASAVMWIDDEKVSSVVNALKELGN